MSVEKSFYRTILNKSLMIIGSYKSGISPSHADAPSRTTAIKRINSLYRNNIDIDAYIDDYLKYSVNPHVLSGVEPDVFDSLSEEQKQIFSIIKSLAMGTERVKLLIHALKYRLKESSSRAFYSNHIVESIKGTVIGDPNMTEAVASLKYMVNLFDVKKYNVLSEILPALHDEEESDIVGFREGFNNKEFILPKDILSIDEDLEKYLKENQLRKKDNLVDLVSTMTLVEIYIEKVIATLPDARTINRNLVEVFFIEDDNVDEEETLIIPEEVIDLMRRHIAIMSAGFRLITYLENL